MTLPSLPPFFHQYLLAIEIFGKEATLPFVSTPLARANAEEHIRQLRNTLKTLERNKP